LSTITQKVIIIFTSSSLWDEFYTVIIDNFKACYRLSHWFSGGFMIRILMILSILSTAMISFQAGAATATCNGKVGSLNLNFMAKGSLLRKNDGSGFVKINGRLVAQFDGDAARISYLRRSFTISNARGDVVEGKLNNLNTGAATLTKLVLPGEGISISNKPVKCSMN